MLTYALASASLTKVTAAPSSAQTFRFGWVFATSAATAAARRLGITIQHLPVHNVAELEESFSMMAPDLEAIVVFPDPLTIQNRQRIVDIAAARRIPVISGWSIFARGGAPCTCGPRLSELYRRAAYYVDRILKGVSPADLPIERPTIFELTINHKTAQALGLTMLVTVLARAMR